MPPPRKPAAMPEFVEPQLARLVQRAPFRR